MLRVGVGEVICAKQRAYIPDDIPSWSPVLAAGNKTLSATHMTHLSRCGVTLKTESERFTSRSPSAELVILSCTRKFVLWQIPYTKASHCTSMSRPVSVPGKSITTACVVRKRSCRLTARVQHVGAPVGSSGRMATRGTRQGLCILLASDCTNNWPFSWLTSSKRKLTYVRSSCVFVWKAERQTWRTVNPIYSRFQGLSSKTGLELLQLYNDQWEAFKTNSQSVNRVFSYLNRYSMHVANSASWFVSTSFYSRQGIHHEPGENRESSKGFLIYQLAVDLWKSTVFEMIKENVSQAILWRNSFRHDLHLIVTFNF